MAFYLLICLFSIYIFFLKVFQFTNLTSYRFWFSAIFFHIFLSCAIYLQFLATSVLRPYSTFSCHLFLCLPLLLPSPGFHCVIVLRYLSWLHLQICPGYLILTAFIIPTIPSCNTLLISILVLRVVLLFMFLTGPKIFFNTFLSKALRSSCSLFQIVMVSAALVVPLPLNKFVDVYFYFQAHLFCLLYDFFQYIF